MWVRFHDDLRKGKKRGLPRAARFIYMELSSEARPLRGVVELPLGMSLEDGLHDVLGGDRRELLRLFPLLTVPGKDEEEAMVRVEGEPGAWKIVLPTWKLWNGGDDSTERVRAHRARLKTGTEQDQQLRGDCNALQSVTVTDPVTPLEKSRGDQIRSDPPVAPRGGATPDGAQIRLDGSAEVAQPETPERRGSRKRRGMPIPVDWVPQPAEVDKARSLGFTDGEVAVEAERFVNHFKGDGKLKVDWDATFRNWLINEKNWAKSRGVTRHHPVSTQRAPPPNERLYKSAGGMD